MDTGNREANDNFDMQSIADTAVDVIRPGKIFQGEVVTLDSDFAYVNVGTKSDGRVPLDEFPEKPAIGSMIPVMMQNKRPIDGIFSFSHRDALREIQWQKFQEWCQHDHNIVTGRIVSSTNKGKVVECEGVTAFLPYSLAADLKTANTTKEEYPFKIKSIDRKKRSILLSRKDFIDEENAAKWENFISKYKTGDVVRGVPVKYVEFGVFVRVEGIDGLLHRNDMSWKKVFKQRKIVKLDEERDFLILDINNEEHKISLGLKQLAEDPWLRIEEKIHVNDIVTGRAVTVTAHGVFIEIEDGLEGFVPTSELSWKNIGPAQREILRKGEEYRFIVLAINSEEKRISLGYKQLLPNPWDTVDEKFPVGSIHTKKIKKKVKFGMFVELDEEIDGLVHLSDITWSDDVRNAMAQFHEGDEVQVKVLDIRKAEMKIACGIKQLTRSPWEEIRAKYPPKTLVNGTISGITSFGLFVKIENDVEGLVHISEISRRRIENLEEHFKTGDEVTAVVLGVDIERKRLSLSIKQHEIASEKEELDRIMKSTKPSTVTLGDMIDLTLEK